MEPPLRVDQLLSRCGYCSRREAQDWLRAKRVTCDGVPLQDPAMRIPFHRVRVDGEPPEAPGGLLAMFHKPAGVVCSRDAREGATIYDLLPPRWSRRHPPITSVGRLDKETTGLLLVTDVGPLVQRWTSPRRQVPKTYEATVDGRLESEMARVFAAGTLVLDGERDPCLPAQLEVLSPRHARVHLTEGRFRQVRRMFAAVGLRVVELHRSGFGEFALGDLPVGAWKTLPWT